VTVAEEQVRAEHGGLPEDGFMPANSAAIDAIVDRALTSESKPVEQIHPMFRKISSDSVPRSRRTSVLDEDHRASRRREKRSTVKVEDDVVEVLSSDEEERMSTRAAGRGRQTNGLLDHDDGPDIPGEEDELSLPSVRREEGPYVTRHGVLSRLTEGQDDSPHLLSTYFDVVNGYELRERRDRCSCMLVEVLPASVDKCALAESYPHHRACS